jgi:hypothetical protein
MVLGTSKPYNLQTTFWSRRRGALTRRPVSGLVAVFGLYGCTPHARSCLTAEIRLSLPQLPPLQSLRFANSFRKSLPTLCYSSLCSAGKTFRAVALPREHSEETSFRDSRHVNMKRAIYRRGHLYRSRADLLERLRFRRLRCKNNNNKPSFVPTDLPTLSRRPIF